MKNVRWKKMYGKIILERPSSWLPSSWLHYTDALQNNLEMLHDWVQKNGDKSSETTLSDDLSKYKVLIINWMYFFFVTNFNSRQEATSVSRQMSAAFHLCNFPLKNIMLKIVKKIIFLLFRLLLGCIRIRSINYKKAQGVVALEPIKATVFSV